jgi:type I restriction enzyme, S subunit
MSNNSSLIPMGWKACRLGEMAKLQRGFDLPTSNRRPGDVPIISSSGFSGTHDQAIVDAPGVVTGRYGTIGELFWIDEKFWPLNTSLFVSDFHGNYPKFIYYYLQSQDFKKFSDKTGVPGINRNDIHKINVVVPPLSEQKKIAEILGTWDEAIALTEKAILAKRKLKHSIVSGLLSGNIRMQGFEEGWRKITLDEVISSLDAGVSVNSEDRCCKTDEIGILKTSAVTYGVFLPNEHKAVIDKDISRVSVSPKRDKIIISRMNTPKLVGASVYIDRDYPNLFLPDRLWQIEPKNSEISMRWLSYVIGSKEMRSIISSIATGTSKSMKNISKESLLSLKIKIPCLQEQQEIVSFLSLIDMQIKNYQQYLELLNSQKCGLMQKLLTGKWRVTVESDA